MSLQDAQQAAVDAVQLGNLQFHLLEVCLDAISCRNLGFPCVAYEILFSTSEYTLPVMPAVRGTGIGLDFPALAPTGAAWRAIRHAARLQYYFSAPEIVHVPT